MSHNKYTKAELVIGGRKVPLTVRRLVEDYYNMYTTEPDELGFLTYEEVQKMRLSKYQREVFSRVVNDNLRRLLLPQSGLRISIVDGLICPPGTVSHALRRLQEKGLVRTMNIIDYASFFARYEKPGKPKIKFPPPLNMAFSAHLNYFTRPKGSSKASLRKLFGYLGRTDKGCKLPRYSYATVLYKGEPLKRVFPKPKDFIPFQLYDIIISG